MARTRAAVVAAVAVVGALGAAPVGTLVGTAAAVQAPVAFGAAARPTWQTDGIAWTVAASGGVVAVGGAFSSVRPPGTAVGTAAARPRSSLVLLSGSTGAPTSCAPEVTWPGNDAAVAVRALAFSRDGRTLYLGGSFTRVQGVARQYVAALDVRTCRVVTSFAPRPSGPLRALATTGAAVYLGGTLDAVGGAPRTNLAAVTAVGTRSPGALLPWAPRLDGEVWTIALRPGDDGALVIGGSFRTVGGRRSQALAALRPTGTGALLHAFGATIPVPSTVKDVAVDSTGFYTASEGEGPTAFDGRTAVDWTTWRVRWRDTCEGATQALAVFGGVLYSGSHVHDCSTMHEFPDGPRRHLVAQSVRNPTLLAWTPDTDDGIGEALGPRDMVVSGAGSAAVLYVVGEFTTVNGRRQQGITRFTTGPDATAPSVPTPRVDSPAAGAARVRWAASVDPDDGRLTYRVYRDHGARAVAVRTAGSLPWRRPALDVQQAGLARGSRHVYRVTATDGRTTVSSGWVAVRVR